jgi:hypothetical protein
MSSSSGGESSSSSDESPSDNESSDEIVVPSDVNQDTDTFDDLDHEEDDSDEDPAGSDEEEARIPEAPLHLGGDEVEVEDEAVEVCSKNIPRRGDREELLPNGRVVLVKGAGTKNRKEIAMAVCEDRRFKECQTKAVSQHNAVVKRAVRSCTGRPRASILLM